MNSVIILYQVMVLLRFSNKTKQTVSGIYKTSCKTGEGVEEMFTDIARQLAISNRSRKELQAMEETSFQVDGSGTGLRGAASSDSTGDSCSC